MATSPAEHKAAFQLQNLIKPDMRTALLDRRAAVVPARIKAGIHSFKMPHRYSTNAISPSGWVIQGINKVPNLDLAMGHAKECVAYLSTQLYRRGDLSGAVRCAMLLRHFFGSDTGGEVHDAHLHTAINKRVRRDKSYLFGGVDSLNAMIDNKLTQGCDQEGEGSGQDEQAADADIGAQPS